MIETEGLFSFFDVLLYKLKFDKLGNFLKGDINEDCDFTLDLLKFFRSLSVCVISNTFLSPSLMFPVKNESSSFNVGNSISVCILMR